VDALDLLAALVGAVLIVWMLVDSFLTLLATNLRNGRWSFTGLYYRTAWRTVRSAAQRVRSEHRRERLLSVFGPASFLGLLVAWTTVEILGWGLVWWALRDGFSGAIGDLSDAVYYSGVVYFSIGFGDILPVTGPLRFLTVLAGLSGLGTLGLVIGFIPSLTGAYSARERQLLLLDDLTDHRVTPMALIRSHVRDGDVSELNRVFEQWSGWCAEVYDSHASFPMLMWFRSKHRGQSWITALGVVTDAAIAVMATVDGVDQRPAERLYRQSVRLVSGLGMRVGLEPAEAAQTPERWWSVGYGALASTGLPLRGEEESLRSLIELQEGFHPWMEAFIEELLAPNGFWGPTAADHLALPEFEQRLRAEEADGPR
jgi:hypothetical protein